MMFPTVIVKGVVAKMAAGCRATAMLDGERAGDCLTCSEDQSQNQNIKSAPIGDWIRFFVQAVMWWRLRSGANAAKRAVAADCG
jgi:hypothetical protein